MGIFDPRLEAERHRQYLAELQRQRSEMTYTTRLPARRKAILLRGNEMKIEQEQVSIRTLERMVERGKQSCAWLDGPRENAMATP